jgi:DNA-binding GntR family transcriptional regulator
MDPIEEVPSDTGTVIARLRQLIVAGHWSAGMRLAEIPVAQSLGLSRTPVRLALRTLEQEGLVEKAGTRGYVVRAVSEADIRSAIEVRGALEGLAARRLVPYSARRRQDDPGQQTDHHHHHHQLNQRERACSLPSSSHLSFKPKLKLKLSASFSASP